MVTDEDLEGLARNLAPHVALGAPLALQYAKEAIGRGADRPDRGSGGRRAQRPSVDVLEDGAARMRAGFNPISFERRGAVALVGLDDPATRNAISEAMRDELLTACLVVEEDPGLRALVLHGTAAMFSSGANLREFGRLATIASAREVRNAHNIYGRILRLPVPTVAVIETVAAGGGLELVLSCDVRIAVADARLGLPEVRRGFIPGGGGTQLPLKRAGARPVERPVLEGELISAEEARRLGLVHETAATPEEAWRRALAIADDAAQCDSEAMRRAKRVLLACS